TRCPDAAAAGARGVARGPRVASGAIVARLAMIAAWRVSLSAAAPCRARLPANHREKPGPWRALLTFQKVACRPFSRGVMSNVYSIPPRPSAGDAPAPGFSSVEEILAELRAGRMVIILDDEDRENEGDFIMAAEHATPEAVAFMIRHSSGILCTPM